MDLNTYQQRAHEVAAYSHPLYPFLGLAGEVGEAIECLQRSAPRDEIGQELGDICWCVQEIAGQLDFNLSDLSTVPAVSLAVAAGQACELMKKQLRKGYESPRDIPTDDKRAIAVRLAAVLWHVEDHAIRAGLTLGDVMCMNLEKLTGRVEKGTLYER